VAAKNEQKETTDKKSGGSKKKWIFVIGGILVLAIVAGVVVFFLMRGNGEDDEMGDDGEQTHESSSENNSHTKAIYSLEPLIVNIHDGPELRYLKIKVEFEIKDADSKKDIDPFLAPMQDSILMLLSGKQMGDITTSEGKNKLKNEIMADVGKILPQDIIKGVYFTDFVVQ
jgi:flagellar FliL protein